MRIYEYILIPEISDKYLDRILIECIEFKDLEKYLLKEDTSKILKFEKAKLKINPKKYTIQQIKELGVEYINSDTEKKLYNVLANATVLKVSETFSKKLNNEGMSINIFNNTKEFIKNINAILKEVDICLLISYIRLKHKNLFNIIPSIIKELENSAYYSKLNIPIDKYNLNYNSKFSEKYGIDLEFENNKEISKESTDNISNDNKVIKNNISTSIESIINKLKEINSEFININSENNRIKELEVEVKNKDNELKKIYKDMDSLKKENIIANENLEGLNKILSEKENSIENLYSNIKYKAEKEIELKSKISILKKEYEKSKKQLKLLDNKIKELSNSLQSTCFEMNILKEKNINLEEENRTYINEIENLNIRISNLCENNIATNIQINNNQLDGNSELDNPLDILDNPPMY